MFRPTSSVLAPIRDALRPSNARDLSKPTTQNARHFFNPSFARSSPFPRTGPIPPKSTSAAKTSRSSNFYWTFPSRSFQDRHPFISVVTRLGISSVVGLGLIVGVILVHDSFTYSERHVERVPTNPLSLNPRRGGKKTLPILEVNLDEEESEVKKNMTSKPKLVIVGGGWGVSFLCLIIPNMRMEADV